jgi:hypothetical protein
MEFTSPLPSDLQEVLEELRAAREKGQSHRPGGRPQ